MRKVCKNCQENYIIDEGFYRNKNSKDGYFNDCKKCCNKKSTERRLKIKESKCEEITTLEGEEWRSHRSGLMVSNLGRVFKPYIKKLGQLRHSSFAKKTLMNSGYYSVCFGGERLYIHRIVLECFNDIDGKEKMYVNHLNCIRTDNRLENLEWCTHEQNIKHAIENDSYSVKLKRQDIINIRSSNKTVKDLSNEYSVSDTNIRLILGKKIWKHF